MSHQLGNSQTNIIHYKESLKMLKSNKAPSEKQYVITAITTKAAIK